MQAALQMIIDKNATEVESFRVTHEMDDNSKLYEALFDHYCNNGEMPYGVAKAREGDPLMWVHTKFLRDLKSA